MVYIFCFVFFVLLILLLKIVCLFFFFLPFCRAHTMWNGLWCSRWGVAVFLKCVFLLLHSGGCVARTLECWSRIVSIRDGRDGETAREWMRQTSVLSLSHCVSKSMAAWAQNIKHHFSSLLEHPFWLCLMVCLCGNCYTWTCVPWVCRLWTLDRIFFWWPARLTPILASSLRGRWDNTRLKVLFIQCVWNEWCQRHLCSYNSLRTNETEAPAVCTWRWCRGWTPSWHIQHWKSSLYTGPSWWPPTTHPLSSHWTPGWTALPGCDTKHTHILVTSFLNCLQVLVCRKVQL